MYPESEVACKHKIPLYKIEYSKILFEYEKGFDMKTGKLFINPTQINKSYTDENTYFPVTFLKNGNVGGNFRPQDKDSTRLQELSLMNNTYFGAIHYDIHLDLNLDYTINRILQ